MVPHCGKSCLDGFAVVEVGSDDGVVAGAVESNEDVGGYDYSVDVGPSVPFS